MGKTALVVCLPVNLEKSENKWQTYEQNKRKEVQQAAIPSTAAQVPI